MKNKKFYLSVAVIVFVFMLLMSTSLLLELEFVQLRVVRQIVVYLFMALEMYIGIKAVLLINTQSNEN